MEIVCTDMYWIANNVWHYLPPTPPQKRVLTTFFLFSQDVVKKIENVQTGSADRPVQKVEITQSGVIDVPEPFEVAKDGVVA